MSQIIDGKELAKNIRLKLKDEVIELKNADINPKLAVISVGKDNSYGHPHKETMELLEEYQLDIYRTDIQGTIVVTSDGNTCKVETFESIDLEGNSK